jgi:Family of unknown function (DUF6941)
MRILTAHFCEGAHVDDAGKLHIHGIFFDRAAPGFPAKQDHMVLVVVVEWEPDDQGRFRFRLDLKGDGDKPSFTVEGHTDVGRRPQDAAPPRTYLIMPMEDIVFPRPGPYRLEIRAKGETLSGPTLYLVETADEAASR